MSKKIIKSNDIKDHTKESKEALRDLVREIKEAIYPDGRFMYFDKKLKLVARAKRRMDAQVRLRKYVEKDIKNRANKYYFLVEVSTYETYKMIFDKKSGGGVEIWAGMDTVIPIGNEKVTVKFISDRKDKKGVKQESTVLWISYKPKDILKFKINDPKRVVKSLIKAEYGPCITKPMTYSDMKWSKK